MASNYIAVYKRFNGVDWDTFYFATLATQVSETAERKFLTSAQQGYFTNKDAAGGVPILVAGAKIALSQIPDLSATYLTKADPTFTGVLTGPTAVFGTILNVADRSGMAIEFPTQTEMEIAVNNVLVAKFDANGLYLAGLKLTGLAAPVDANDAVRKSYVDNLISIGVKPVQMAKAVNFSGSIPSTLISSDGITPVVGDRILMPNLSAVATRGVYLVTTSGTTWTKITADSGTGALIFIESGDTCNDTLYYCQNATTGSWIVHSKMDTYKPLSGGGLQKNVSNEFSLASAYGDTINPYASKTKNYVLAAPSTANGIPVFRALVPKDLPILEVASQPDFTDGVLSRISGGGGHLYIGLAGASAIGLYDTGNFATANPDLIAIESLAGTTGLLKKTAANTWALDTAAYITGITKAMVEAVLTGIITTHSHTFGIVAGSFAEGNHLHAFVGSAAPGTTGYRTGDLYFQGTVV